MNRDSIVIIVKASKSKLRVVNRMLKFAYGSTKIDRRLRTIGIFRFNSWYSGALRAAEMLRRLFFGISISVCAVANPASLSPRQCRAQIDMAPYRHVTTSTTADSKDHYDSDRGMAAIRSFSDRIQRENGPGTPDHRSVTARDLNTATLAASQFLLARELLFHGLFRSDQFLFHKLGLPHALTLSVAKARDAILSLVDERQIVGLGFESSAPNSPVSICVAVRPQDDGDTSKQISNTPLSASLTGVGIFAISFMFAGNAIYQQLQGQSPVNPELAVYPASGGSFGTIGGMFSVGADTFGVSCGHVLWNGKGFETHASVQSALSSVGPVTGISSTIVPVITKRCEMPIHDPADPRDVAVFGPVSKHPNIRVLTPPFDHAVKFLQADIAMVGAGSGKRMSTLEVVLGVMDADPKCYSGPVIFHDVLIAAPFTAPGDSGALWFDIESGEPLGVHTLKQEIDGVLRSIAQGMSCLMPQFRASI